MAIFWLLRVFVLSASCKMSCIRMRARSAGKSRLIVFRATVRPALGSLALYTAPDADLANSLTISKRPIFAGIAICRRRLHWPGSCNSRKTSQALKGGETLQGYLDPVTGVELPKYR